MEKLLALMIACARRFRVLIVAVVGLMMAAPALSDVILSEIVPVNRGGLRDADGDSPDWIELFNNGPEPVDLSGCTLTDDSRKPDQWELPDASLAPGAFLIIFASGKDRAAAASGEWHANFKLSAAGEYVGLFDRAGKLISSLGPDMPPIANGQSFGLPFRDGRPTPDGRPGLLPKATPNAPNPGAGEITALRAPVFSKPHGFYAKPFRLALKAEGRARINYTLDGTTPTESNGLPYRGAIPVTTTTVVRALAFGADGRLPSATLTQTYLFPEDVARQPDKAPPGWPRQLWSRRNGAASYGMRAPEDIGATHTDLVDALKALPSLSLVTDSGNLWNRRAGIWAMSQYRGSEWERPLSVELLDPNGDEEGFQINCGVRVRGGYSRSQSNPKHAMRLYFRKKYGAGKLRYPLFGGDGARSFEDIDLRTAQNYSWSFEQSTQNSFVREVFARDTQRDMGRTHTRSRYYHLYLNGMYWGIYQTQEHAEAAFGAAYFGGESEDFDAVKSSGHSIEPTDGDLAGWDEMWSLAGQLAQSRDADEREALYQRLKGCNPDGARNDTFPVYVDEGNLIDYMLIVFYAGMWDGPITRYASNSTCRNWFGIWKRGGGFGFQYFCHDFEHSLGVADSLDVDRTGPFQAGWDIDTSNPQWIHQQLMASESYLAAFQQRSAEVFAAGGLLSPEVCRARLNLRVAQIDRAIIAESARWGGSRPLTRSHWRNEIEKIHGFFDVRGDIVKEQLLSARRFSDGAPHSRQVAAPLYPGNGAGAVAAPEIAPRPDGAYFLHDDSKAEIFYTLDGSDPRSDDGAPAPSAMTATAERVDFTTLIADAPFRAFVPADGSLGDRWIQPKFNDSRWMDGRGAAGYETKSRGAGGTLYHELIDFDLFQTAAGKNTTVFLRLPFTLRQDPGFQRMRLLMRFDDGFVAYLNGKEICRANAPDALGWNVMSGGKHDDDSAVKFVAFDVSSHAALLRPGANLLAIHAINDKLNSSDMLIEPQLRAGRVQAGTVVARGDAREPPIIRARARRGNAWSSPARLDFNAGATLANAGNLTISEIHYHPAEPSDAEKSAGHDDANAFEFIELANTSDEPIDLAVTQLAGGISFVFLPGQKSLLAANSRCVVVNDMAAFKTRHGNAPVVAGEFNGKLGNGGDALQLIAADGTVIHSIRYSDKSPWPKAADGDGPSLELRSLTARADLSRPGSWKASASDGGTPGK